MENPTSFTSDDLVLVRRNRRVLAAACLPFLGVPAAIVAGILAGPPFFAFILHALLFGFVTLSLAYQWNPWPVAEPVPVRADPGGVQIGGRHVPRAEIRAGYILPGDPPKVLLRLRGFASLPILLQGGSQTEERDLLRVLGLDVSQTVAHFRTLSRVVARRRYLVAALSPFVFFYGLCTSLMVGRGPHPAAPVAGVLFAVGLIAFLLLMLMPTQLDVGADGLVLTWLGRKRFIRHGDITGVRRYEKGLGNQRQRGVALTLKGGEEVLIPVSGQRWSTTNVAIIEERIREALEAHRQGGAAADSALLRRGDRDPGGWVAALRAVGAGANADMRTAPVPRERLFRIVEDPTAPPTDRAAAAVAIGGDIDAASRARLRAAAEATAAPRLRVVLEEAAKGEDEAALIEALAEVEAGEGRRGSPSSDTPVGMRR